MLTKAFCAIATTVVLLLSTASAALAAPDLATLTRAPAATREILTLAPGETEASTTIRMRPDVCAAFLRVFPGHSDVDCVTRFRLTVSGLPTRSISGVAAPMPMNVASYWCGITVEGLMANVGWNAHVSQTFCIWPGVSVYPKPYGTQCGNFYGFGATVTVTWCGGGRSGWTADGGENVTISMWRFNYGAGQRVSLSADWRTGQFCWNAFC